MPTLRLPVDRMWCRASSTCCRVGVENPRASATRRRAVWLGAWWRAGRWQARTTEGVSGLEIGRRDIELFVFANQPHDFRNGSTPKEHDWPPRGLVCEGDFQRMKIVAAEFEHFGRPHGCNVELARQMPEQIASTFRSHRDDWNRRP